jgi:membrane-associated protein
VMNLIDFVLHIDRYIDILLKNFGIFTYIIFFAIVFCETGLVIAPFLPGDSLLFVAGAFAAKGSMSILLLFLVFFSAAVLGDSLNYWIGNYFGERAFAKSRLFKKEYLEKSKEFYHKHGGKTVVFARFIPIIRTFAPFVAGVGKMSYPRFLFFNIFGGLIWVSLFLFGGYFFGGLPFVEENMTIFIFAIIFFSLIPPVLQFIKHHRKK